MNDVTLFGNCVTISVGFTPTFMRLLNPPVRPIEIGIYILKFQTHNLIIMKLNIKKLAIVIALVIAALINPKQISAQQENVSFQVFYDALSPYGQWVDYRDYGYVWIPDVGPDFAPYSTDGFWAFTDYGWTWVSDYDWGWAPFHYGRWAYDNYYGWLWVPDNEWGPSWVNWRSADGYYGWSPMEPGISLSISFGRPYNRYNDHWTFVRDRDFERRDIYNYSVDRSDHAMIFRNSTVINQTYIDNSRHTTYVTGPAREDVQRVTGRRISPVAIRENSRPGQDMNNGQLRMYRPQVVKNGEFDRNPAPRRIENLENVKRPSERNVSTQPRNNNNPGNNNDIRERQSRDVPPVNNNERQQQNNNTRQQNINRSQPSQQPQQAVPAGNNERQQQNNMRQQNINRSQPSQQPQQAAPAGNNERLQQENNNRQQNNRTQPAQQQQEQKATPASNSERQLQQNNYRAQPAQQQQQKVEPAQQQQQKAAPAGNNGRQQQNIAKPQKEQQKDRKSEEEKKPNN